MRWLLDTNILIDAFAGRPDVVHLLKELRAPELEWVGYSAITRLEILGFAGLNETDENGLRQLLAEFEEAQITSPVIERAIQIRKSIRIKIPDALLAATALVHQAKMVTRNTVDLRNIEGLAIVSPIASTSG